MTEPRDDLARREELAVRLQDAYRAHVLGARVESLAWRPPLESFLAQADALLAAYPQLAATESEEQWAILCTVDDVEGIDKCEDEEHARYKLARFYPRHHNAVSVRVSSRTVYATPWEDA